jgi:predicted enzyme related to lactoylglutathione lyase
MPQPVVHWEIASTDAKHLQEFYAALFDWNINADNDWNYAMVETGGEGGINGGIFQVNDDTPPYLTFYVRVDDLPAYLTKAEQLGAETVLAPEPIPGVGSVAMFRDPEGRCIGLFRPEDGRDR